MPNQSSFDPSAGLVLRPDVVVTVLDQGAVLLDLQSKFFYSANSAAWAVVRLFETGTTREKALDRCHSWGVLSDDVPAVNGILDMLLQEGLVAAGPVGNDEGGSLEGPWCRPVLEKHPDPLQKIMVSAFDPSIPLAE